MLPGLGCVGCPAAPALPPRPWGRRRLLWVNKPQAEVQLVTRVSRQPQPWGRNTEFQGQAPAWRGWGWVGTLAGPTLQAGTRQVPVTRVLVFSARHGVRCSSTPSSPHAGADSSLPLTHSAARGSWEGTTALRISGRPVGTPQCLVTPFISSPPPSPGEREGWLWGAGPAVLARLTTSRWDGSRGQDLTPCRGCGRGCRCVFSQKILVA